MENTIYLFIVILSCTILISCTAEELWQPEGVSREEWIRCRGIPCQDWKRRQLKFIKILSLYGWGDRSKREYGRTSKYDVEKMSDTQIADAHKRFNRGCAWMSEDAMDEELDRLQNRNENQAKQRNNEFYKQWPNPIPWKFDGTHDEERQTMIKNAMKHWEENTCIRFKELKTNEHIEEPHLVITGAQRGCTSYIGKNPYVKQQMVNLHYVCLRFRIGEAVHVLGHAIGLQDEECRQDRDNYIDISGDRVQDKTKYVIVPIRRFSPYDFNSIMHNNVYFFSYKGIPVKSKRKYSQYRRNMGQREGLSFFDAKGINLSPMCKFTCKDKVLEQKCERGGYQDPNNCDRCRCPLGFSGSYCEKIVSSNTPSCNEGSFDLKEEMMIQSPNYPNGYPFFSKCTWYFKVAPNQLVQVHILKKMEIDSAGVSCRNFIEIRGSKNLEYPGPRICLSYHGMMPKYIVSEGNELLISFRSNFKDGNSVWKTAGFGALITPITNPNAPSTTSITSKPTTATTTTTATTSTTTATTATTTATTATTTATTATTTASTTTASTTTTTASTTTTTEPSTTTTKPTTISTTNKPVTNQQGSFSFNCGFETGKHDPESCGIKQSKSDMFDWSPGKGKTPSGVTGPDSAHSGQHYVFIEASNKAPGDNAIIELPAISHTGTYCMNFWYHMYGYHINKLIVYKQSGNNKQQIWTKKKDQGQSWFKATVKGSYEQDDTILFEGVRGGAFSGDIALDDISIEQC